MEFARALSRTSGRPQIDQFWSTLLRERPFFVPLLIVFDAGSASLDIELTTFIWISTLFFFYFKPEYTLNIDVLL